MKLTWWLLILIVGQTSAQIPRNKAGTFEYSAQISTSNIPYSLMKERARSFFNQPFLVHWTSVPTNDSGNDIFTARGWVDIHFKNHYSTKRAIPVLLQLSIQIEDGGFRYTINQLTVNKENTAFVFPLEDKPVEVESAAYDRLLKKTHERISFVIDWLKRHMENTQ